MGVANVAYSSGQVSGNRIVNNCVKRVLGVDTRAPADPLPPSGHTDRDEILRFRWCSYGTDCEEWATAWHGRNAAITCCYSRTILSRANAHD